MNSAYEIPLRNIRNYSELYDLISGLEFDTGARITFDLREHDFIEPLEVVMLAMSIIYLKANGCNVFLKMPEGRVGQCLSEIGLREFCLSNYQKSQTVDFIPSSTAMPIKRLDTEHMDEYIMKASKYFGAKCKGKDTTMLDLSIAELINNVYDHANSPIDAYIFSQYFPKSNQIKIVVGDIGQGIATTANRYFSANNQPKKANWECVQWALEVNKSSFSKPHNKGKGLNNIYSFVKSSNSIMRIFSDDVLLMCNQQRDRYCKNPIEHFIGTVVEVTININGMAIDDETVIDSLWD